MGNYSQANPSRAIVLRPVNKTAALGVGHSDAAVVIKEGTILEDAMVRLDVLESAVSRYNKTNDPQARFLASAEIYEIKKCLKRPENRGDEILRRAANKKVRDKNERARQRLRGLARKEIAETIGVLEKILSSSVWDLDLCRLLINIYVPRIRQIRERHQGTQAFLLFEEGVLAIARQVEKS